MKRNIPPPPAVEFQHVSKVYRRGFLRQPICALRDVTLCVPPGSVFALIGPNRAGKTTLVKALLSICRPTAGTILRLGRPVRDRSTLARVGYLHESQAFPRYLTATALLHYYGALSLIGSRELNRRVGALLDEVGLADRASEPIAMFSKGMIQRLALAQALVNDPELLVLDEPTEGMDLLGRKLLHQVIRRRQAAGHTALLVSHNLADVRQLCDRAAVLREGRLGFAGPLTELSGDGQDASPDALQDALEPLYSGGAT
ncbi:MAG: ABC transporter ATP-binding protein [Thermoguttaceae bacterium]